MYSCTNCGGPLHFDITKQMLRCDSCDSLLDIRTFDHFNVAEETGLDAETIREYELNEYVCPNCGGSVVTADEAMNGFCSYCGSTVLLEPRMRKGTMPGAIIPFKITKETAQKNYLDLIGKTPYCPKALKSEEHIERIRGMYIPYYLYRAEAVGRYQADVSQEWSDGKWDYHESFHASGEAGGTIDAMELDAAYEYDDNMAASVGPYSIKRMKRFTPAYLCGLYADLPDVDPKEYREEIESAARVMAIDRLKQRLHRDSRVSDPDFKFRIGYDTALFPVWFLTWRRGSRVAYSVINGETGKAYADTPIGTGAFLKWVLLMAVPLFLMFSFLMTPRPVQSLAICCLAAAVCMHIFVSVAKRQIRRDENIIYDITQKSNLAQRKKAEGDAPLKSPKTSLNVLVFGVLALALLSGVEGIIAALVQSTGALIVIAVIVMIAALVRSAKGVRLRYLLFLYLLPGVLCMLVSVGVFALEPVQDIWYYGAVVLTYASVIFLLWQMIRRHNLTATHAMPYFSREEA